MVCLARQETDAPMLIGKVAQTEQIPKKFLDIILLELKTHGLLASKKGKGGGYQLARPADEIFVGEVVRILDGPIAPLACVSKTAYRKCDDCLDEGACVVRGVMQKVRDAVSAILDHTSIADLLADAQAAGFVLKYDI
jgi:Rrf2 family protein